MSKSDSTPLVFAALGTSLTARGAWLEALPAALQPAIRRPVQALNFARVGGTSRSGLETIEQVVCKSLDVITVEFASNDAALRRRVSAAESLENLTQIIRRLRAANSHALIYLMTMSPATGLRGLLRPGLNRHYQMYVELAQREDVGLIDNRPSWYALSPTELRRALPDGVHPITEFSLSITLANVIRAIIRDLGG